MTPLIPIFFFPTYDMSLKHLRWRIIMNYENVIARYGTPRYDIFLPFPHHQVIQTQILSSISVGVFTGQCLSIASSVAFLVIMHAINAVESQYAFILD